MSPFLYPGSLAFTDQVTDVAVRVLAGAGVARLSIGVVAAGLGMTRQALTQRLKLEIDFVSSDSPPAVFLHEIVVGRFGDRFTGWMIDQMVGTPGNPTPRIPVPHTPDERDAVRMWLALRELARADWADGEPATGEVLASVRDDLHRDARIALQNWCGHRISARVIARLLALADGLQIAVADPLRPMAAPIAQAILDREVRELLEPPSASAA